MPALLYGWPLAPAASSLVTFLCQLLIIGFTEACAVAVLYGMAHKSNRMIQ